MSVGKTLVKGVGAKRIAFFNVDIHSELPIIIAIFSKFNLNMTKHLDFLAFAHAFILYTNKESEYREKLKPILCNIISSMNSSITNYSMPSVHKLDIAVRLSLVNKNPTIQGLCSIYGYYLRYSFNNSFTLVHQSPAVLFRPTDYSVVAGYVALVRRLPYLIGIIKHKNSISSKSYFSTSTSSKKVIKTSNELEDFY